MIDIEKITNIDDKKHIALLDTSSISFMQGLKMKGIQPENILKDYDLILIPEWVLTEINDAPGRANYVQCLIEMGYPIYCVKEESYSDLTNSEEGNLYQIVLASTRQLARIRSYLRRYVEKVDSLDVEAYKKWIQRLYDEWPISEEMLSTGRIKKKNAGEVSITILSEIVSWYYPETKTLTIYSQDGDTYDFQRKAEADLRRVFVAKTPVPVSYKSNDAILCQLVREGKISIDNLNDYRKDVRKITYSKKQDDHAVVLVTELADNELFAKLVSDKIYKKIDMVNFYKSIVDQDRASVVICNLKHEIIYMNPAAVISYAKRGGDKLIGRSLLDCHNPESRDRIQQVVDWFAVDESHNIVYTFHNEKQNKDVYMVALRDEGKLIGYYEKHEYRNAETMKQYDLW